MRNARTRRVSRSVRWGLWSGAALALAAGAAQGQQNQDWRDQEQHKQDQWKQQGQSDQWQQQDRSGQTGRQDTFIPQLAPMDFVHVTKEDGNRLAEVTIVNGRVVAAQIDERPVALHNVQVRGNTIRLTDENNQFTTQIRIPRITTAMAAGREQRFGTAEPYNRFEQERYQDRSQTRTRDQNWDQDRYSTNRPMHGGQDLSVIGNVLGFQATEAERREIQRFDNSGRYSQGIMVERVYNNGPADQAGLRDNDVVVAIDGRTPASASAFHRTIIQKDSDDPLRLTVLRDGGTRTVTMRLDEQDIRQLRQQGRVFGTTGPQGFRQGTPMLGIQITDAAARELGTTGAGARYNQGIRVERVQDNAPADTAGLREGDIIVAIDGRTPATTDLLEQRMEQKNFGDTVQFRVIRDNQERNVNVRLEEFRGAGSDRNIPGRDFEDRNYNRGGYDWNYQGSEDEEYLDQYRLTPNKRDYYRPSEDASGRSGEPLWDRMRQRMDPRN